MFFNRELSWIAFNRRVLAEGLRKELPPLERLKFLSIVSSNFDEFFMVRMAALKRVMRTAGGGTGDDSGMSPREQFSAAAAEIHSILAEMYGCLGNEIFPALKAGGIEFIRPPYETRDGEYLALFFMREILPVLSPLRFGTSEDPAPQDALPPIANGVIYGAFLLSKNEDSGSLFPPGKFVSIVEIPPALDRVVFLPSRSEGAARWALLDDLLMLWGDALYSGYTIQERMLFRIHRDADFSVDERRDEDFIEAMEELIQNRDYAPAVRMVYTDGSPALKEYLARRLELSEEDLYCLESPLNLGTLWSLVTIPGFENLRFPQKKRWSHPAFSNDMSVWDSLKSGDVLLSLPYHSFDPVVRFFREAAKDEAVISIKTALYRTSGDSPVIQALEQAALNGKHVTAVVELKARFDEERNINWAMRLEKAGVIVIYGLARLKVHAKISQVIRRESGGLVRYVHLSTGNYNDRTARQYSDLSLFTVNEDFGNDATVLFNTLSGYSMVHSMNKLIPAPWLLKRRFIELIDRETRRAKEGAPGKIMAKMNALIDTGIAAALYKASQAGVKVLLNVRGMCALVPGLPGLSENIRVISIVDQFLEHSRVFFFNNGGAEEFYISSADWMPRNLERRVELLVPILDPAIKEEVREILECYFKDTSQAWELRSNGVWERRGGGEPFKAQDYLYGMAGKKAEQPWKTGGDLVVRRSPLAEGVPVRK